MGRLSYVRQSVNVAAILLIAMTAPARSPQTEPRNRWEGYLIDLSCAVERKNEPDLGSTHSKKCLMMPACDRSGFGLLSDSNEVFPFDDEGNRKARTIISKTKRELKLRVVIHGTLSHGTIAVRQIELR